MDTDNGPVPLAEYIKELAETGASLSVIEAKVGMRAGTLKRWLNKGKTDTKGPYRHFYNEFRKWAAEAVMIAQQGMAIKTPERWLDRSSTAKVIDDPESTDITPGAPGIASTGEVPGMTLDKAIAALRVLKEQGIIESIDEVVDKGMPLTLNSTATVIEDEDDD